MEHVYPEDFENSDSDVENDPVPDPAPGSPVVTHIDGVKSISFFGFVNSLDVSCRASIHRLCYAAYHDSERTAPFLEHTQERARGLGAYHYSERTVPLPFHPQERAREPSNLSYWQWYRTTVVRVGESLLEKVRARKAKRTK
jgi:hypothetical protein